MRSSKIFSWFGRAVVVLSVAVIVSGTDACRDDYCVGCEVNVPTTTPTEDDNDGTVTRTPTPTVTATASVSGATATPEPTETDDPSGDLSTDEAVFRNLAKMSSVTPSPEAPQPTPVGGPSPEFAVLGGEGAPVGDGTWLGKLYAKRNLTTDVADSDGDGFIDRLEVDVGSDPANPESRPGAPRTSLTSRLHGIDDDADGLRNELENQMGTDPTAPDSDGDGCSDKDEVHGGSNPRDSTSLPPEDSDGDCLSDAFEKHLGSNPKSRDTDGDKVSDSVEFAIGSSVHDPDTDDDGILDWKELSLGSDPTKAESYR